MSSSSIWTSVKRISENDIILKGFYKAEGFSIFIRDLLSSWIEKQSWDNAYNQALIENESLSVDLAFNFNQLIDNNIELIRQYDDAEDLRILERILLFKPIILVSKICKLLHNEKLLLIKNIDTSINNMISILNLKSTWIETQQLNKAMDLKHANLYPMVNHMEQRMNFQNDEIFEYLKTTINMTVADLSSIILSIGPTVSSYLNLISSWKSLKQKCLSGAIYILELDLLSKKCNEILEISTNLYILTTKIIDIVKFLGISSLNELKNLVDAITTINKEVIERSLIIENNPQQVLKTQTKFNLSARLLVDSTILSSLDTKVVVSIISERTAKRIHHKEDIKIEPCGELSNCVSHLVTKENKTYVNFRNIILKSINREDRRCSESVLDAKIALCLHATAKFFHINMSILCLSCPVVVVVHGNQTCASEATIFWDNMFSKADRDPFEVPDIVSWIELSNALNIRWKLSTDCELYDENIVYLTNRFTIDSDKEGYCSWKSFTRNESLKQRSVSMWDWFYGAMELVKKYYKDIWKARLLHFISKKDVSNVLESKIDGAFIIRLSDSLVGCISISYLEKNTGKIVHLKPWSVKDLMIRSLNDRINDLTCLKTPIPIEYNKAYIKDTTINRSKAYKTQYTHLSNKISGSDDDYVETTLRVMICHEDNDHTVNQSTYQKDDININRSIEFKAKNNLIS